MHKMIEIIEENPIIASIRRPGDLDAAVHSPVRVIFLLHADIFNINKLVDKIKESGKKAFVHIDLLEGIGSSHTAVDYVIKMIKPDGIISTKSSHIKYAKKQGMFTIQRFFMLDSQAYDTAIETVQSIKPDMIEILPGVIPRVIKRLTKQLAVPVITGGLIVSKEDVIEMLKAGAVGVSATKKELWLL